MQNQIHPATIEIKFLLSKETVYGSFRSRITTSECKIKAIGRNIGTFRHYETYPGITQVNSGIFRTLCYPDIFKTAVYPGP